MARLSTYCLLALLLFTLIVDVTKAQGPADVASEERGRGGKGGGKGDPIMTSFDGRSFEFFGQVGAYYNVISEKQHQMSMKLKLGQMWDHNGTYMEGVGFRYQDHKIIIELGADDNMHVYLDGKQLQMVAGENEQEHIMGLESGELMLLWELNRPDAGQAVEITTDMLNVVVFLTPAGTLDEGGFIQPAYLNFDAALLGPPAHGLKGIIGEGYQKLADGRAAAEDDDFKFHGEEEEFRMDGYFATSHVHNAFGVAHAGGAANRVRRLIESRVAFPLRANGGRAFSAASLPVPAGYDALGRKGGI
ncbi:hypothetical protein COCOBI_12-1040 [Coccomyxa sp. Obi]|nr:hypothetical protein COCOBI_12-1040 [Coccomyxa sp. Obi]